MNPFTVDSATNGRTLAAVLREFSGPLSWAEVRRLISSRRVRINGSVCLDDARRLKMGEVIELSITATASTLPEQQVRIVYSDHDLVVIEKPAGLQTLRRPEERGWNPERKARQPVLDEVVARLLNPSGKSTLPRIRPVHRLDQDTSGLMLFALSTQGEHQLIRQFAGHEIMRVYWAVAHGILKGPRTIDTWLVRDRGDGIRGSSKREPHPIDSKNSVTHVTPVTHIGDAYTVVECRLETGRTHQIRIHLAEIGHMLCGEKIYTSSSPDAPRVNDSSHAPRQALHSADLQFDHPVTGKRLHFQSSWPKDLKTWLEKLPDSSNSQNESTC